MKRDWHDIWSLVATVLAVLLLMASVLLLLLYARATNELVAQERARSAASLQVLREFRADVVRMEADQRAICAHESGCVIP